MERASGFCENGAQVVITNSITSTTTVQRSYPSCTITVYVTGTTTLATVYADNLGTALGNPFLAQANGMWFFYAQDGLYDVTLSGAGLTAPFTIGAVQLLSAPIGYTSLLEYGAICDGITNVQPAVAAAQAKGITHLFLPPNCLWNPTGNSIPGGLNIIGASLTTSKIWATSPTTTFLGLGPQTTLQNLNALGEGCNLSGTLPPGGCPVYWYSNSDNTYTQPMQHYPYAYNYDVGHNATSAGLGMNAISVIERGDGGGIYGQFNGGVDNSAGSGIQAGMAYAGTTGQGLAVSQLADGTGTLFQNLLTTGAAAGNTCCLRPMISVSTLQRHGDVMDVFNPTANYDGGFAYVNFPATYVGAFVTYTKNNVVSYRLDYQGNETHAGLDGLWDGGTIASANALTITGQIMIVTGSTVINGITFPVSSNFPTTTQGTCIHLIAAAGSTWTLGTGAGTNIAATASNPGVGHQLEVCWESGAGLWFPR